jgi:hypothetical protein
MTSSSLSLFKRKAHGTEAFYERGRVVLVNLRAYITEMSYITLALY